jgi:hypothetical protein
MNASDDNNALQGSISQLGFLLDRMQHPQLAHCRFNRILGY